MPKAVGSWRLFWLLTLIVSVAIALGLPSADFHTARGTTPIILRSVRCALPLFLVAFTASSLATLWPTRMTRWLLSNRRYIGLAFAVGMAWHFGFVAYSIAEFGLFASGLNARVTALDVVGLSFLSLMTLTSFRWAARQLTAANWRRLHKAGVYAIWFVATYIYLGGVRHGGDILHGVAFGLLVLAWVLRVAAWIRRRTRAAAPP
jgi:sulfoxide reductase heme-binding subunit YedZ